MLGSGLLLLLLSNVTISCPLSPKLSSIPTEGRLPLINDLSASPFGIFGLFLRLDTSRLSKPPKNVY